MHVEHWQLLHACLTQSGRAIHSTTKHKLIAPKQLWYDTKRSDLETATHLGIQQSRQCP
jgi:hypothetical protein